MKEFLLIFCNQLEGFFFISIKKNNMIELRNIKASIELRISLTLIKRFKVFRGDSSFPCRVLFLIKIHHLFHKYELCFFCEVIQKKYFRGLYYEGSL